MVYRVKLFLMKNVKASGILPICYTTGRALIGLRSSLVDAPNTWCNFGGTIKGNNFIKSAIREFIEETKFHGKIKLIHTYTYKIPYFEFRNYIGLINKEFTPKLNWEHEKYRWVDITEIFEVTPLHHGLNKMLYHSVNDIFKYMGENDSKQSLMVNNIFKEVYLNKINI